VVYTEKVILPITLCLFTSTKGHFGRKTDWRLTVNAWDRLVGLSSFGHKIAHIKCSSGEESLAEEIRRELREEGFETMVTPGDWSRGLSHGSKYLGDMVTVSKNKSVYKNPYFLLLEDDSPVITGGTPLVDILSGSCKKLDADHELLTVRTIRRGDYEGGVPHIDGGDTDVSFCSPNTDFQPMILRTSDYYRLCIALERNPQACEQIQCEMLWRLILDNFSRSPFRHMVYKPDYCEALHIGTPQEDHEAVVKKYL
jgi:hypothetical protein